MPKMANAYNLTDKLEKVISPIKEIQNLIPLRDDPFLTQVYGIPDWKMNSLIFDVIDIASNLEKLSSLLKMDISCCIETPRYDY